jgi:hypothetical protein
MGGHPLKQAKRWGQKDKDRKAGKAETADAMGAEAEGNRGLQKPQMYANWRIGLGLNSEWD